MPDAPPYVLGVICLRDQVLPLLDFIQLLRVEDTTDGRQREMVILLNFGEAKLGIAVDGIQEIIRLREEDILPPPRPSARTRRRNSKAWSCGRIAWSASSRC